MSISPNFALPGFGTAGIGDADALRSYLHNPASPLSGEAAPLT